MIRPLVPEDVEAFYALRLRALKTDSDAFVTTVEEWESKPMAEVEKRFRQAYSSADELMVGAFADDKLVGMMGFQRYTATKLRHKGFIWGAYVAPEARRQGLAGEMLDSIIRLARSMRGLQQIQLSVVTGIEAPLYLYESRGFQVYGLEKDALFVGDHTVDLTLMTLFL